MDMKETFINKVLEKRFESSEPVEEIVHDLYSQEY